MYEALLSNLGVKGVEVPQRHRQEVREAAGRRHLVDHHAGVFLRGGAEGVAFHHRGPEADPDAQHGPGRVFRGTAALHRGTVDRRAAAVLTGMEPTQFEQRVKWHLLCRMVPLVENNFNVCELGPRGTGKSHIYKEISPNSILISGGQTTVANLFYNMARRHGRAGRSVGRGGLRRSGGHLVQGQGRRPDHEGLHGLGVVRPWP